MPMLAPCIPRPARWQLHHRPTHPESKPVVQACAATVSRALGRLATPCPSPSSDKPRLTLKADNLTQAVQATRLPTAGSHATTQNSELPPLVPSRGSPPPVWMSPNAGHVARPGFSLCPRSCSPAKRGDPSLCEVGIGAWTGHSALGRHAHGPHSSQRGSCDCDQGEPHDCRTAQMRMAVATSTPRKGFTIIHCLPGWPFPTT